MARRTTFEQGEFARLRCPSGVGPRLIVQAPDGSTFALVCPRGTCSLWLPQVGSWRYRWEDSAEINELTVTRPSVRVEPEHEPEVVSRSPMRLIQRPRR